MKKVVFTLFLLVTTFYSANAQTIVAPEGKYEVYCDMISVGLWGGVGAKVDMGNSPSKYTDYEYIYEDGEEKKFTSMMGALDYMSKRGWHLHTIYVLQETVFNKVENVTHYLMVKFVTDDSQKRDGLDLQTK